MSHQIINFYKFVDLNDAPDLVVTHRAFCLEHGLLGKILLADEGVNAALSGEPQALQAYMDFLHRDERFSDVVAKWSIGETKPFRRMIVKIKPAIVTFTQGEDPSPAEIHEAPKLSPEEWHQRLLKEKDQIVLVDTRNDYECDWGTFKNAEVLPIKKFSDFPQAMDEKFAEEKDKTYFIFCTGGIRCEKAAPYMIKRGYKNVFQLDGGILKYLEQIGSGLYEGSCFVFDQRWALSDNLLETGKPMIENVMQPKPEIPSTAIRS